MLRLRLLCDWNWSDALLLLTEVIVQRELTAADALEHCGQDAIARWWQWNQRAGAFLVNQVYLIPGRKKKSCDNYYQQLLAKKHTGNFSRFLMLALI